MSQELRVLIIEDSKTDARLIERVLQKEGFVIKSECIETADALSQALETTLWDVIISDYSLPSFRGTEALKIVQNSGMDIPFIMVSGVMGEDIAVAAMQAGAHDYMMKDNLNRLAPAIRREIREVEIRKSRKVAMQHIEKLHRALAQSASLVLLTNIEGDVEYVNRAFCQVTGYLEWEIIGENIKKYLEIEDETGNDIFQLLTQDEIYKRELHNWRKDKTRFWSAVTITSIYHDDHLQGYLVMQEDITRRKQLEEELKHYTELLETMVEERTGQLRQARDEIEVILNHTNNAIVLSKSNGDIRKINPAFRRIFGDISEAIEEIIYTMDVDTIEIFAHKLLAAVYERQEASLEVDIEDTNGSIVDLDINIVPISQSETQGSSILISMHDVTRLKEIDRAKTKLVANIAHDIASPISVMKNQLYLIRRIPEKLSQRLGVIEQQITHLEQFMTELRTLSQVDQGTYQLDLQLSNLNTLVQDAIDARNALVHRKNQTVAYDLYPELPTVLVDRDKFWRVIINLIDNAIRYTPNNGHIIISTNFVDQEVILRVQDFGIGISEEALPKIFERFYRSGEAQSFVSGGSGIGLAIVKEIIALHNGRIEVHSEIGEGTTFEVFLSRIK